MKHKLFHTLVLSGVALVEGCATAPSAAPAAAPAHGGHSHAAPLPAAPASPTEAAARPEAPSAEAVRAMVADARSCADVGWSTTKSASSVTKERVVHNDRVYWCLPEYLERTPRCCAAVPGVEQSP